MNAKPRQAWVAHLNNVSSHPDFNRRSWNYTKSTERWMRSGRRLSLPVRNYTDPGNNCLTLSRREMASRSAGNGPCLKQAFSAACQKTAGLLFLFITGGTLWGNSCDLLRQFSFYASYCGFLFCSRYRIGFGLSFRIGFGFDLRF